MNKNAYWWSINPVNDSKQFYSFSDTQKLETAFLSGDKTCELYVRLISINYLNIEIHRLPFLYLKDALGGLHCEFRIDGPDQCRRAIESCTTQAGLVVLGTSLLILN